MKVTDKEIRKALQDAYVRLEGIWIDWLLERPEGSDPESILEQTLDQVRGEISEGLTRDTGVNYDRRRKV